MLKKWDWSLNRAINFLVLTVKPHKKWYFIASSISLISVGTGLLNTKITQVLIDSSIKGTLIEIFRSASLFLILILVNMVLINVSAISISKLAAYTSRNMKRRIAYRLVHAEYSEIVKQKTGDVITTINSDTKAVTEFLGGDLIRLFSQAVMLLGAMIYIISISPLLALITFAYTPFGMFFSITLNRKMNKLYPVRADKTGEALSIVDQVLMQIPVIKSFMMEKLVHEKVAASYQCVYETEMKLSLPNALLQTACASTSSIPRILFFIFAGYKVMHGELSLGTFIAVFDLLFFIIGPTVYFPFMMNGLNKSIASINRISRIEDFPLAEEKVSTVYQSNPSIKIDHLNFGYSGSRRLFENFSFSYQGFGIVAIKGKSGSGKTTLLDLVAGLFKPDSGTILVSGDISAVSQDSYLFGDTVENNIHVGKIDATDNEVLTAIMRAGADKFLAELPNNFHTIIGDGNGDLSGGQKQRLSLARTILSDASIWLLDEPTSALDVQTEQVILTTLKAERSKRLIIVSAHQQSLLDIADVIIDLDTERG